MSEVHDLTGLAWWS